MTTLVSPGIISTTIRDAEIVNVPFLAVLAGCSARRSERGVAGHTSEEQRRNAPASAVENGILAVSASLSVCELSFHPAAIVNRAATPQHPQAATVG